MMKEFYSIFMHHRLKKLLFQATHRGTRENDFILGSFVRKYLPEFTEEDIQEMEEMLTLTDQEIVRLLQAEPFTPLLIKLRRFCDEELSHIIQHTNSINHGHKHDCDC